MLLLDLLSALVPLGLMVYGLLRRHWNGAQAGLVAWLVALALAALQFGATPSLLFWAQVRGWFQALYILYIIWGALIFYRVTEATGAIRALTEVLAHLSPQRETQVMLLAWVFASFLQSVGGFGVPVAVTAPLLVNLSLSPLLAVALPSLGHAWAVSFGSLGSSYTALVAASGVNGFQLNLDMALCLLPVCLLCGAIPLAMLGGRSALRRQGRWLLLLTVAMGGGQLVTAVLGWPHGAALIGTLIGMAVATAGLLHQNPDFAPREVMPGVGKALRPYALLVGLIILANYLPFLNAWRLSVAVPETMTTRGWVMPAGATRAIAVLGHPGALLIYAALVCYGRARLAGELQRGAARALVSRIVNRRQLISTLGLVSMVCLATTMEASGMMDVLARATASTLRGLYVPVAPWVGLLGAFVTGSNTSANVLFGAFQRTMALQLGISVTGLLAVHNAGAAIGSIFAPAKIIVGCSTVGLEGSEGRVLRALLVPVMLLAFCVSMARVGLLW